MHLTEHDAHVMEVIEKQPKPRVSMRWMLQRRPATAIRIVAMIVRAETGIVLVTPVVWGMTVAWWQSGTLNWVMLLFSLAAALMGGWGLNALSDYGAHVSRATRDAGRVKDPYYSAFGLIRRGWLRPEVVRDIGLILTALWLACTLWLALLANWPVLVFAGLSVLAAAAYLLLPRVPGYEGWGIGDLCLILALGVLPALSAHFAQYATLDWLALAVTLPCGLLLGLVYLAYDAVHLRRDWLLRRPTLPVLLNLPRTRDLCALLALAAYGAIVLLVISTNLPLIVLVSLAPLPVLLGALAPMQHEALAAADFIRLYRTAINASAITALLFWGALFVVRLI